MSDGYLSNSRDIVKIVDTKEGYDTLKKQGEIETKCCHAMRIPKEVLKQYKDANIDIPSKHYCNFLYNDPRKCDFKERNFCKKQDYIIGLYASIARI